MRCWRRGAQVINVAMARRLRFQELSVIILIQRSVKLLLDCSTTSRQSFYLISWNTAQHWKILRIDLTPPCSREPFSSSLLWYFGNHHCWARQAAIFRWNMNNDSLCATAPLCLRNPPQSLWPGPVATVTGWSDWNYVEKLDWNYVEKLCGLSLMLRNLSSEGVRKKTTL